MTAKTLAPPAAAARGDLDVLAIDPQIRFDRLCRLVPDNQVRACWATNIGTNRLSRRLQDVNVRHLIVHLMALPGPGNQRLSLEQVAEACRYKSHTSVLILLREKPQVRWIRPWAEPLLELARRHGVPLDEGSAAA